MLPDFPEIKRKFVDLIMKYLRDSVHNDPLISQLKEEQHFEGDKWSMKTEDGELNESSYKKISSDEINLKREDIIKKGSMAFIENFTKAAEEMKEKQAKMIIEKITEITDKTGNVVNGKGSPFTFELYLEMLEKVWIDFDDQGNPHLPTLIISPDMAPKMNELFKEWQKNPDYEKRIQELIKKKKAVWDDRESHRKLVD
jgi:hypothetical protein